MKKLMLLGGLRYLIPVIEAAHKEGCHVITCDYLPDNIAHKYSDEYHNLSITDKEAVLELARRLGIDGIMSFAVDPGVTTAAYVAENLNLPFAGSYKSVGILQNKALFRDFLTVNNFNVPKAKGCRVYDKSLEDDILNFNWPVIVKPVDSAGSKGVTRIDQPDKLKEAFGFARSFSLSGQVIIEEYIEKRGYSSDSDGFSVNGKLECVSFNSQYFDDEASNPYTPSAYSWPSSFTQGQEAELKSELQRLITLLNLKTSVYNIEVRVGKNDKPYIMEFTPRGGGNRLSEMVRYGSGVDFVTNAVRGAIGLPVDNFSSLDFDGYWAEIILHSNKGGKFDSLQIDEKLRKNIVEEDLWLAKGDPVNSFQGANDAIGTLVFKFETQNEMESALKNRSKWINVIIS
ncbi:MAG: carboxylate--amine ligase [Bacteroidia bacterium 44-10]|mgnify:CR=1 FL=1|nr:MAG: carboxylate--amine ligase [Bacteroidia bacterium 44-10]